MPTASPSLLHSLLSALCLLTFAFPLHAQTQPAPPKFNAAGITTAAQLQQEIMAAKRPKSDKWSLSLPPNDFQGYRHIDYIVVAELTDAGLALPVPDFHKRVYYTCGNTHDSGYEFLQKQLCPALVLNGYWPSDADHPPTQVIFFAWGVHKRMEAAGNTDNGVDVSANSNDIIDLLTRAKTVGGEKFADEFARALAGQLEWSETSASSQNGPLRHYAERYRVTKAPLVQEIFNNCYYLIVYSLDFEAFSKNQKKLLWITRISTTHITTPSQGLSLGARLPIMMNDGGYFCGRETDSPEIMMQFPYKNTGVPISDKMVAPYISGSSSPWGLLGRSPKIVEIEAGERTLPPKVTLPKSGAAALPARIYASDWVDQKPVPKGIQAVPTYMEEITPQGTQEGSANITFVVETDGTVGDIEVMKASPNSYGAECVKAIAKWRYSPAMLNDQPVRCRMIKHFDKTHPQGSEPSSANQSTENPKTQRRPADTRPSIQISVPEAEVVEYISGTTSPSGTVAPATSGTCATHPETFDKK